MEQDTKMPARIRALWADWHPEERAWLKELRDAIQEQYQDAVRRVLLFGSKARGDWHDESDIDVIVIVRDAAAAKKKEIARLGTRLTPLYVKNARGSTTARSVRGELKALASLVSRSPRTVNHGRQPAARVLRCAPALRVTAAADRAGSPCGPAGRLALDPLPGSATPASHSVVAENRRQTPEWDRVHLPDRGFAVARTIRKHAVGILAYLDTRMTERARGRTHPARPTG